MRGLGSTIKQRNYARYIMNEDITRQQAAELAGYSKSAAEHPARIESSNGFKLAMAGIAGETGKAYIKTIYELQLRDLSKEKTDTLLRAIETLGKAFDRFIPKDEKPKDEDLQGFFNNVINVTPEEPVQNSENVA